LFSNQVNAQQKGFRGGIMAGACASQVDGDKLSGYNKGGFQGGIFLSNKLNDKSGFSIEMKYIQKGSRTTSSPPDSVNVTPDRYYKLRLSYIEVPFLANYYLKKKFMLESGLGFAYLFRVREDTDGNGMTTLGKYDIPFKHFDFPFYFGVAFCPFENFHINFRYSYSTMAIRNHPGNQTWYFDRGQYNNLLSFGVYLNL
jgi:hypothetical protein